MESRGGIEMASGSPSAGKWLRATASVVAACGLAGSANAAALQDPAAVQAQAERFLKMQNSGLPGRLTIEVKPPRAALPACAALEAFQTGGVRSIGRTTVGVRCLAPRTWTVYLAANVRLIAAYAVTRHPLPANHVLTAADLTLREGNLGDLPTDVARDVTALPGYRTVSALAAGAPLRAALLRAPLAVQQGQT
ncbi:flagellar basal body P-ring formation chaperone FlgA, partial [Thiobacillus sp.]